MPPMMQGFLPLLFPVGTTAPVERRPVVTYALIGLTTLAFAMELLNEGIVEQLALWPRGPWHQFVTYALMHSSPLHLFTNMYALWIFGSPLESRVGRWRFVALYALTAAAGGLAHQQFSSGAHLTLGGASGAVMGLIGAYMILFPFSSVRCLFVFLVFVIPLIVRITEFPAIFFVILYWLADKAITFLALGMVNPEHVSTACHIGGLLAGIGLSAACYGFRAFSPDADDDKLEAKKLERKLKERLRSAAAGSGKMEVGPSIPPPTLANLGKLDPESPLLQPLRESVVLGQGEIAEEQYRILRDAGQTPCLPPAIQMDLARLMISRQRHALAAEALEILIARYPYEEIIHVARLELARQLIVLGRERGRALSLLREFLASQPLPDLEREARILMQQAMDGAGTQVGPPPIPDIFASIPVAPAAPAAPAGTTALFDPLATAPASTPEDSQIHRAKQEALFGSPSDLLEIGEERPLQIDPLGEGPRFKPDTAVPFGGESSGTRRAREVALFGNPDDTANMNATVLFQQGAPVGGQRQPVAATPESTGEALDINTEHPHLIPSKQTSPGDAGPVPLLGRIQLGSPDAASDDAPHSAAVVAGGAQRSEQPMPATARRATPPAPEPVDLGVIDLDLDSNAATDTDIEEPPPARLAERPAAGAPAAAPIAAQPSTPSGARGNEAVSPEAYAFGVSTRYGDQSEIAVRRRDRSALREAFRVAPTREYALLVSPEAPLSWPAIVAVMAPELSLSPDAAQHAMLRRRGVLIERLHPVRADLLARQMVVAGQTVLVADSAEWSELPEAVDVIRLDELGATAIARTEATRLSFSWDQVELISAGMISLSPKAPPRLLCDLVLAAPLPRLRLWENLLWLGSGSRGDAPLQFHARLGSVAQQATAALQTRTFKAWQAGPAEEPPHRFASLIEFESLLRWHRLAFFAPQKEYRAE